MSVIPGYLSLTRVRSTTWNETWNLTDNSTPPNQITLTGYSASLALFDVNSPLGPALLTLSSTGISPAITLSNTNPSITLTLTPAQTAFVGIDILFVQLLLTDPSGNVECYAEGKVYLKPRSN